MTTAPDAALQRNDPLLPDPQRTEGAHDVPSLIRGRTRAGSPACR